MMPFNLLHAKGSRVTALELVETLAIKSARPHTKSGWGQPPSRPPPLAVGDAQLANWRGIPAAATSRPPLDVRAHRRQRAIRRRTLRSD